jgi:hypothetical protein
VPLDKRDAHFLDGLSRFKNKCKLWQIVIEAPELALVFRMTQ